MTTSLGRRNIILKPPSPHRPGVGSNRSEMVGALMLSVLMLSSGCLGLFGADGDNHENEKEWWELGVDERHVLGLNVTGERSHLPEAGPYEWVGPEEYYVDVDLPAEEQDAGYPEPAQMHVALWMPVVPEGVKVPVIATIHPYYDFGGEGIAGEDSSPNTIPDGGVGQWVLDQFVPHGYALAQISTFGTGKSTHCQDVKGRGEQIGIDAAVTWLGEQEWSNGHVGLMGKSYAGTTNWEAAQFVNPYLKTIVPISGSIWVQQMFYRNGSSESRAMVYDALYEGATMDPTTDDMRLCSDDIIGPATPWTTYAAAEVGGDRWNDYWEERYHLPDVLENYGGSVYIVWGLQDWNVDPYHAFPAYAMLREAGIPTSGMIGQWAHNYPDQPDRHSDLGSGYGAEAFPSMSRMDWAIELYVWFEYYLKGIGDEPIQGVQIQTNDGLWHLEETWPPSDIAWQHHDINQWTVNAEAAGGVVNANSAVSFVSPAFENEMHISGLPTLHLEVSTQGCNGGQIFATLWDETDGLRLGHAVMDIRYRDGGYDAKPTSPIGTYTMLMEFNPLDVMVPAEHVLSLELTDTGEDYLPSTCALAGLSVQGGMFGMPLIDRPGTLEEGGTRWLNPVVPTPDELDS